MAETYPEYNIGTEIEVLTGDDYLRGEVIGINYTCPVYMYVVQLEQPIEGEFGKQTGLYVPESILVSEPDSDELVRGRAVGQYVYTDEDGSAYDAQVSVATTSDEAGWYVLIDSLEGVRFVRFTPFDTEADALEEANTIIDENHEAAPGETAEKYMARIQSEGDNG